MAEKLKGIHIDIYTDEDYRKVRQQSAVPGGGSLTLFGKKKTVTLVGVGVDGRPIDGVFEATEQYPAVRIQKRGSSISVVPVEKPQGLLGPMMGGAYVASSDGRVHAAFGFYGAVALHDRFETAERYAELSQ